jgi:hypothetical protein
VRTILLEEDPDRQSVALATTTGAKIESPSAGKTIRPAFAASRHWKGCWADVVLARNIGYVCARLGRKVGKAYA